MKGRKPKLKVIEGGKPAGACPAPPAWLSAPAKAEWKRAAQQLHDRGLLADDTLATLESYCIAVGTVRDCERIMAREGRIVAGKDGPKPHPAFKMQAAAMREARLLASELGLTPHRRGAGATGDDRRSEAWGEDDDLLA
jgi:P27 family predicted phage terminase small subunit